MPWCYTRLQKLTAAEMPFQTTNMSAVLVLNATYEPLSVVSMRRAVVLLLKEKAEILEATEREIHAANVSLPTPLVIRLVYYVRVPHRVLVPFSRKTVLMRDKLTCQYCGAQPAKAELTLDHVLPKVRGGPNTWENVVCACKACNNHKGSRTPEEANMALRHVPQRPKYLAVVVLSSQGAHDAWVKYIPEMGADLVGITV